MYTFNKQTLSELAQEYCIETNRIQSLCDTVILPTKRHDPRPIALAVDTTFFTDVALVVFRDQKRKESLDSFTKELQAWHVHHELFLIEKTCHPNGRWSYTHRRLRSALNAMIRMSPYLFTYQRHSFFMLVTTNTLEGFFSHLKTRVRVHRGISLKRKKKMIALILLNSSTMYEKGMHEKLF